MLNPIKCLTFSGGGIKGLSYVGCLRSLEEHGIIPQVDCLIGTSAGSFFATCITVGYSSAELRDIVLNLDFNEMRDITSANLLNYFSCFGFDTGNRVERILRILIKKKTGTDATTFKELYDKTQKTLIITGTCLNTREVVNFSYTTHPDMEVITAIRISMSVPFVFNACRYENDIYVDGGVGSNYSVDAYTPFQDILGFLLQEEVGRKEINGLEDYAAAIIRTIDGRLNDLYMTLYPNITVKIQSKVDMLDFNIKPDAIQRLIQEGYNSTNQYLQDFPERLKYETESETVSEIDHTSADTDSEAEPPGLVVDQLLDTPEKLLDTPEHKIITCRSTEIEPPSIPIESDSSINKITKSIQELLNSLITDIQEKSKEVINPN